MICNRSELGDVLGVHRLTIGEWVKEGMPYRARPDSSRPGESQWKFDTGECVKWLTDRAKGHGIGMDDRGVSAERIESDAKARERVAIAGLKEMEYAERLKVMVHVDDVIERVEEQYAIVKSRLQAIPGRMAQALAVESDASAVERALKDEVGQALEELSGVVPE
jgi:phage terminase Nu1 subunit (DNA packaging protein)